MKIKEILMVSGAVVALGLAGCSSYRGGAAEDYSTGYGQGAYPTPMGSPTFRPGMNPNDLRDPNALTQPRPPNSRPGLAPDTEPHMIPGKTP